MSACLSASEEAARSKPWYCQPMAGHASGRSNQTDRQLNSRRKMIMMRKPMKALVATGALALATVSGAGAVLATATPASADVLVNYDGGTIHLWQSMRVGVWYQQSSGGSKGYWAGVWSVSAHKWIFTRSGYASATGWKYWSVKPPKRGKYHTVYNADGTRVTFYTTVR
jgi:hypothetical protein